MIRTAHRVTQLRLNSVFIDIVSWGGWYFICEVRGWWTIRVQPLYVDHSLCSQCQGWIHADMTWRYCQWRIGRLISRFRVEFAWKILCRKCSWSFYWRVQMKILRLTYTGIRSIWSCRVNTTHADPFCSSFGLYVFFYVLPEVLFHVKRSIRKFVHLFDSSL